MNYNLTVSTARISARFVIALVVLGAGCGDKQPSKTDTGALNAIDRAGSGSAISNDTTPLPNIDIAKLAGDRASLFYKLVNSLKSPCGKPHSLRTSYASDTSCKRAPFAVRYVVALLEDEASEDVAREEYGKKYDAPVLAPKFDLRRAPRIGNDDAPVRIVEFFDYACPHCRDFKPVLEQVAAGQPGKVVEYFMMFPLGNKHWPHSKSAAQAALAANAQGRFQDMHTVLFAKGEVAAGVTPPHSESDVAGYANSIGLDPAKFAADYTAAAAQVESDRAQGEAAGVNSTPGIFVNERRYEGPIHSPKYLSLWVEEEIAVNR